MPSAKSRKLSDAEWNLLQERADQFADALHKGQVSDWDPYLELLVPDTRRAVLHELIKIDMDHRWSKGQRPLLEEYLTSHSELGDLDALPVDLICEEYRIRKKRGGNPEVDDYMGRFPEQYSEVEKELEKESKTEPPKPAPKPTMHPPSMGETLGTEGGESVAQLHTLVSSPSELLKHSMKEKPAGTTQQTEEYKKTDMLGHGHFGEVWKATAAGGIDIAIKVITQPIERDAAQRELQALELVKNLRHPCLLATHRFWIVDSKLHIAMELADGSLRDRLKQCRKQNLPGIPRDELLMYFADAAEGLDFLHSRKVFHRDIKPDNIMLLHGHAKVADFGLARLQERQMMTVSFAGTPVYMAPEAWGGRGGPNSDQYSLAFAYAELRQGRRPIEASDFTEVMSKTLEGEPDLSGIPPEESKIVKRGLAKKPEERFKNCGEFVAALARATGNPVRLRSPQEADLRHANDSKNPESATFKESYQDKLRETATATSVRKKGASKLLPLMVGGIAIGLISFLVWNFVLKDQGTPTPTTVAKNENTEPENKTKITEPPITDKDPVVATKDKLWLPARFVAVPGSAIATVGVHKVPEQIEYKTTAGDTVRFRLIAPGGNLRPFYMMETKVTNSLFHDFADAEKSAVVSTAWKSTLPGNLPAVNMTAGEAHALAKWLGGKLPTTQQWDEAAGIRNRAGRDGPSLKFGTAAIGRAEPRSVDDTARDEGPYGTRDMAGNGREWTRDLLMPDGSKMEGPLSRPNASDLVVLRGRNFTLSKPLTYADMDYEAKTPQTQYYVKPSPWTGFRVVIEIPE